MNGPQDKLDQTQRFEKELTHAMRHVDAPAGFADLLLHRATIGAQRPARFLTVPSRWRTLQMWSAGAVAAALVMGVGIEHRHHSQERAEATRQFEIATQIEQQALDRTREKLSRSGISLEPQ